MLREIWRFVRWGFWSFRLQLSRMICEADYVTMKDACACRRALERQLKMLTGKDYVAEPVAADSDVYRVVPWEDRDKSQWFTGTVEKGGAS